MNNNISSLINTINSKNSLPSGTVASFAGNNAPKGWLLCNGDTVSRVTYKSLFEIIGTTFGNGDGESTFNLPDLRGRVIVSAGQNVQATLTNRVLGAVGGEENHTLTLNEIPAHTHTYDKQNGVQNINAPDTAGVTAANDPITVTNTSSAGGGLPHNVMQPFIVLNHIIKI